MTAIQRLGVLDAGETAVRVLDSVGGLNSSADTAPITTVLFHSNPDPQPWYAREADEVRRLPDDVEQLAVEGVVAVLQKA